jgi:PKHD-type hydroxylase
MAERPHPRFGMLKVHTVPGAFSTAECDRIVQIARDATAADARLVGAQRDHGLRRSELVWLDEVEGTGWVMDRIIDIVRVANREVFGFDLRSFSESAQVARYGAERKGHFDWHADIGEGKLAGQRKLTMVVQLSEPSDYSGGRLEVSLGAPFVEAAVERGTATLFPAYMLHRVTPVETGERMSLTIWAHGPSFV